MHRFAILISGGGGLMRRVAQAAREPGAPFAVDCVIASKPDCAGLGVARSLGVPACCVERRPEQGLASFSDAVWSAVEAGGPPDTVLMLGWLHLLLIPPRWAGRVINVHPSLLPRFGGKGMWGRRVHEAVLRAGERTSGFTFHLATDEYDAGPIVRQERVHVAVLDTPETLEARVIEAQHRAILPFLHDWIAGRVSPSAPREVAA